MNLRIQLAAALLALTLGGWECGAISGGGAMSNGSVGGARTAGVEAEPGVQWTIPPVFEYAAYLESGADNDPIETPACRGTLCSTLALTQATLASRPTLRTACPVGATTKPCYRLDGGDWVADAIARTELAFLHDGTGMTCLSVWEVTVGAQQVIYATGDSGGAAPGISIYLFSTAQNSLIQNASAALFLGSGAIVGANATYTQMIVDLVADTPDAAVFHNDFTAATATGNLGSRATTAPLNPLHWGGNWGMASGNNLTGWLAIPVVCWAQRLTTAEREAEQVNLETYFGGAFPL